MAAGSVSPAQDATFGMFQQWAEPLPACSSVGITSLMTPLNAFGLFAVTMMVLCYAYENRSHWFVLGFASSCLLGSTYGFLQGAWPFGLVEAVWAIIAMRKWWVCKAKVKSAAGGLR